MKKSARFVMIPVLISLFSLPDLNAQEESSMGNNYSRKAILSVLAEVADYQLKTPLTHTGADWTNGALYAGMVEWAGIAGEDKYYNWLKEMGEKNGWTYNHRDDP